MDGETDISSQSIQTSSSSPLALPPPPPWRTTRDAQRLRIERRMFPPPQGEVVSPAGESGGDISGTTGRLDFLRDSGLRELHYLHGVA